MIDTSFGFYINFSFFSSKDIVEKARGRWRSRRHKDAVDLPNCCQQRSNEEPVTSPFEKDHRVGSKSKSWASWGFWLHSNCIVAEQVAETERSRAAIVNNKSKFTLDLPTWVLCDLFVHAIINTESTFSAHNLILATASRARAQPKDLGKKCKRPIQIRCKSNFRIMQGLVLRLLRLPSRSQWTLLPSRWSTWSHWFPV